MSRFKDSIRGLRAQAHKLKPIILIGQQGLTDAVHQEIDRALHDHELIKIRIHNKDRDYKKQVAEAICTVNHAILVQTIGHCIVVYRKAED